MTFGRTAGSLVYWKIYLQIKMKLRYLYRMSYGRTAGAPVYYKIYLEIEWS